METVIAAMADDRPGAVGESADLLFHLLVLLADLTGQYLLGMRLPVGVVTGVLGAPYLIFLLIRSSRSGGSL